MAFVRNNNNNNNNNRRHNNNYNNNRPRNNHSNAGQPSNGPRRHVSRINQVFESNGPESRVRGTAQQIVEKYATLGRDAAISGDRVLSMNYFQHAEHYQRLLNEITEENAIFEKERDAQRQLQQAQQPELSPTDAAEGFVAAEQPATGDQPREQRAERAPRNERPERQERSERPERQERAPRPQQRERRPADDIADDELPSFLHVPIKVSKPPEIISEAPPAAPKQVTVEAAEKPRVARVPRPRRVAPTETAEGDAE